MRLLIIEDDSHISGLLARGFGEEGFEVDIAENGLDALTLAQQRDYDCLILDVMLPGLDGISVCRRLRQNAYRSPILMLTVRSALKEKVEGLASGADDYLTKPFAYDELLARVHALIRRRHTYRDHLQQVDDLSLDLLNREARRADRILDLSPKEFNLLEYFLRNRGRVISERELLQNVWGLAFNPRTNIVNVYLHRLRQKVDPEGSRPLIHTQRGEGFRLGEEP